MPGPFTIGFVRKRHQMNEKHISSTKKARALALLFLCGFVLSCSGSGRPVKTGADPYWDDLARYLAGMPVREDSPFKPATLHAFYQSHVNTMNTFWGMVLAETVEKVVPWRAAHLPETRRGAVAFYPFSGADLVNLYTFFPEARVYLLIALEEPGPIPEPLALQPWRLAQSLVSLQRSIWSIAADNYFKSGLMQKELYNHTMEGITPLLLIFAARLDLRVVRVERVGLESSGEVMSLDRDGLLAGARPAVTGTRLHVLAQGDRAPRTVTYLRMKLHDSVLDEATPEGMFFKKLGRLNVLIKSAVYLLHRGSFADICRYLLERSTVICQDDSGIPFRYFSGGTWEMKLFGTYTYPRRLKDLPDPPYQPDLAAEYARSALPLPFDYGYGVLDGKGRSNLLCAVKHGR